MFYLEEKQSLSLAFFEVREATVVAFLAAQEMLQPIDLFANAFCFSLYPDALSPSYTVLPRAEKQVSMGYHAQPATQPLYRGWYCIIGVTSIFSVCQSCSSLGCLHYRTYFYAAAVTYRLLMRVSNERNDTPVGFPASRVISHGLAMKDFLAYVCFLK